MQPAVIGNLKTRNTAVSPPAYEAGGDRVADPARVRDELRYALAAQRLGMTALAKAAFRRATLLREATPTD